MDSTMAKRKRTKKTNNYLQNTAQKIKTEQHNMNHTTKKEGE